MDSSVVTSLIVKMGEMGLNLPGSISSLMIIAMRQIARNPRPGFNFDYPRPPPLILISYHSLLPHDTGCLKIFVFKASTLTVCTHIIASNLDFWQYQS